MTKYFKIVSVVFFSALFVMCAKKGESKLENDSMLEGTTTILVDETLKPIIEAEVQIFESRYDAKINIVAKSEAEVIQSLVNDKSRIAILSRGLSNDELKFFEKKKITPKIRVFAKDAIALIANKNTKDTLIALQDVIDFIQKKNTSKIKGLVFDNPNSSIKRYFSELIGNKNLSNDRIFSFSTNAEVIKYVAQNNGIIGVIGINTIFEPIQSIQQHLDNINVLDVKNIKGTTYFSPTQNNIAEGTYPLARDLYIVNCQGYSGLGMGFTSFINSDVGQRIILKSGLVPATFPPRKILVRKEINNDKK